MSNENKIKGNALEKAVHLIQETILKSDPKFAGIKFSIERNKIEIVAGVRHEIDVLVRTLPNSHYESVWIFECKNWNTPVGKNELIVLSEKVGAVGATKGFLVAREFTADAEAQAKLDNRLGLVLCTDEFLSPVSFNMMHSEHELAPIQISLKQRGVPPLEHPNRLDWKTISCRFNGRPVNFAQFVMSYADKAIEEDEKENQSKYKCESSHHGERSLLVKFDPGEFVADSMDVEYMRIDIKFWVAVRKLKLISKFEFKNQDRVFSFEPIDDLISGKQIQIDVVHRI